MARLFISHSSRNNDKAIEVRDWLAANGWTDVFLDLDPERGIVSGQRWKEALQKAAHRCEVVLALVSAEWLASGWCKSEIDAARLMGKKIIVALTGIDKSQMPLDLADEQWIDLTGDQQAYRRLKEGLKRAGLDATSFPFEAGRRPYPGFAFLEEKDAAVFFGRDAQIVRGLDEIRRLVRTGVSRMLVVLGASGSGKSSFLRAGLWPRLKRDDRTWLPLPIIRPERAVISGTYGLAQALQQVVSEAQFADGVRQRGLPRSRADIQDFIEKTEGGLVKLFAALRDIGQVPGFSGEITSPPTIILAIDQGEELFNAEGRDESRRFCDILTASLKADPHTLAILAMRSDSFRLVQADPTLGALPKDIFTLDMMLAGSYRAVIEGPARLMEPTPLRIDPQLTDALLKDISGQDALPLLAFTLAKLYELYAADNELSLSGYDRLGGLKGVIDTAVKQAFAEGVAKGDVPKDAKAQLALARTAFIPHLAQVNAVGQFVRRVAARDQIPAEARPLTDRFADQRLLIKDRRQNAEVIEVAHEALLRQPPFSEWLAEDREFLVWRERLSQARAAFAANERGLLAGRELQIARGWAQMRAKDDIEPDDQAFIRDSIAEDDKRRADEAEQERKRHAAEKEEQERRIRDAERIAAARKRTAQVSFAGLAVAVLVAAVAVWQYFEAGKATKRAQANLSEAQIAQSRFLADQAHQRNMAGDFGSAVALALEALPDGTSRTARPYVPEAELQLDGAWRELRERLILVHEADALSAAFSPDGKRIVTASDDKTARLWDADSGNPIGEPFRGHTELVSSAAFSPDGTRIVTASLDKTARLWNAVTGQQIVEPLRGHTERVSSAAFSPDGKRIVTASDDQTARLWDAETGDEKVVLKGHEDRVLSAAFSPDGNHIVTASGSYLSKDKTARLWDAKTGKPVGVPLRGHSDAVLSAAFSPDSKRIVTASDDQTARLWDAEKTDEQEGNLILSHKGRVSSAAFSPDGKFIATASDDMTVRLSDAATGRPIGTLIGHAGRVSSATFSPDSKFIVTASYDKTVRLWDMPTDRQTGEPLIGREANVAGAAFSPDGKFIVTASYGNEARLWEAKTGNLIGKLLGHDDQVRSAAFSPDGKRVVTASFDNTARLWDADSGKETVVLKGHTGWVRSAAFNPDGKRVVTASFDNTARLWDPDSGKEAAVLKGHTNSVLSAAFSPDGKRVVTASEDNTARLWDANSGKEAAILKGHTDKVQSAAFSPDGKRIVTASSDQTARLWDADSGNEIAVIKGHTNSVLSAAFSLDGKRIVTASDDRTARVWDAATGKPVGEPLTGHAASVTSAAFSRDGKRIVTASADRTARVLEVFANTEALVSHAKAHVPRCLTGAQRQEFYLPPEPPLWCIELGKWPYHTPAWKQWLSDTRAGKNLSLPVAL